MQVSTTSYLAAATVSAPVRTVPRDTSTAASVTAPTPPAELPPLQILQGAELEKATADFAADVGKMFRAAGISVPPEVMLTSDYAGQVVVANNHPDKARIEAMFKDNPEMRDRYAEISAASSLQRAFEGYEDFTALYQKLQGNPQAQAALVNDRIARNNAQFFMSIGADGAEPFFGGLGRVSA